MSPINAVVEFQEELFIILFSNFHESQGQTLCFLKSKALQIDFTDFSSIKNEIL